MDVLGGLHASRQCPRPRLSIFALPIPILLPFGRTDSSSRTESQGQGGQRGRILFFDVRRCLALGSLVLNPWRDLFLEMRRTSIAPSFGDVKTQDLTASLVHLHSYGKESTNPPSRLKQAFSFFHDSPV
jgi:hypothetical protein